MKRALIASTAALSLGLLAGPAWSSPFKQAEDYFNVRDRAKVVTSFTPEEVQTHAEQFEGKLLEVRGLITAVAGSDTQTTLLIERSDNSGTVTVTLPPGKPLSTWPFLDANVGCRMLCQVVKLGGSATGSLELVTPVKEYEALSIDQKREAAARQADAKAAAAARAAAQRQAAPGRLSSRGMSASTVRRAAPQNTGGIMSEAALVNAYASAVRYFNRRVNPSEARTIAGIIIQYSKKYGLDARLVMAVIACESNFNTGAVSRVGAAGLGQLMPGTAAGLGVTDAFDARQNLEGSTKLLSRHIQNMQANGEPTDEAIKLALACYNAGAGAVKKYKGIPPYRETQNYVKKITRLYHQMCGVE